MVEDAVNRHFMPTDMVIIGADGLRHGAAIFDLGRT